MRLRIAVATLMTLSLAACAMSDPVGTQGLNGYAATRPTKETVTSATLNSDVNDQADPVFAGTPAIIDENGGGGFLPMNGNEAALQTANSAPQGFGVNTVQLAAGAARSPNYAGR